ncbi:aspartate aminotransferase family protein [Brevibacillus dissolubilis]|uniref:aspartate aminotransferase family protein n=1 Tax=Brevibacillus dissolubilis TaxID=1844116 RepID=UPI0011161D64|nr:acetylornithine transaminase [Brevibacillus dissolubilis]
MMSTYSRLPIAIAKGEGNYLYDVEGKSYLDLFTGLAVSVLGHSHPAIVRALHEQGEKFLHISNIFLNTPAITLAQRLVEQSLGTARVFFTNSGAEATEAAIKLIHKWTAQHGGGRRGIVVLKNSFHGRTLGALRLTRQAHVYQDFPQPDFPVYEIEVGNIDELRAVCKDKQPAAVLMEPVLGSGGVIPLEESYLQAVEQIAREHGTLVVIDEIQTGMGRTGRFFAYQHAGITPDLILFAKGVGGGLPLGGIIANEKLMNLFKPGDHGTTFAPAPLSAALGNAVLDVVLDEAFVQQSQDNANYLWTRIQTLVDQHPELFSEIRGKGMMLGIQTKLSPEQARHLQQDLLDQGILVDITQKTIVRLLPPLTLTQADIDRFLEVFGQSLSKLVQEKGA